MLNYGTHEFCNSLDFGSGGFMLLIKISPLLMTRREDLQTKQKIKLSTVQYKWWPLTNSLENSRLRLGGPKLKSRDIFKI